MRRLDIALAAMVFLGWVGNALSQENESAPAEMMSEEVVVEESGAGIVPPAPAEAPAAPEPTAPAPMEEAAPAATEPAPPAPSGKFIVFLPERVDAVWFWWYYTDERQYIVQSAVEKALLRQGFEVIDLSTVDAYLQGGNIQEVTSPATALKKAKEIGADYAVIGQAQSVPASESVAYGITIVRATADASAKILRVSDGQMLAMEEASSKAGEQSRLAACQAALKEAGNGLAQRIARAAVRVTAQ